jgi:rhamnogalacturonyl hydrolase YesR
VEAVMERVVKNFAYQKTPERLQHDWKIGTFFTGVMQAYRATGNPVFRDAARGWSEDRAWRLKGTPLFADNLTLGQVYADFYLMERDPRMIAHVKEMLEPYFTRTTIRRNEFYTKWTEPELPFTGRNVWWWCDALYMAPPLFVQAYRATGEQRYLDTLHKMYWDVTEFLYDREAGLFTRDLSYLQTKNPSGKKQFWSRGNGWVYGGLVHLLEHLPREDARYADYMKLYQEMTAALLACQGEDGLWRTALTDHEYFPQPETTGTAFFAFGLFVGIDRGWLPAEGHLEPALRAWQGLMRNLDDKGLMINAQVEAEKPGKPHPTEHIDFAQGIFLLAAAELYRLDPAGRALAATHARLVPERLDDFAWENDLVAFRTYGPAARVAGGPEDSGIDVWKKRVHYPIVDKWYAQHLAGKSYHQDHGEGLDAYHVGRSRGAGGLGLWTGSGLVTSGPFLASRVTEQSRETVVFELDYRYQFNGRVIDETKTIRMSLGKRLMDISARFTEGGKPVAGLPVAAGLTTHNGTFAVRRDAKAGWVATWGQVGGHGLGTGLVVAPGRVVTMLEQTSAKPDESHALVLLETDAKGEVAYRAGAAWSRAGLILTPADWHAYLANEAR